MQVDGTIVDLTRIEYDVLEYLATHLSRVCTREEMVLAIWSSALTHDHHLVDVHVANLRGKLRRHSDATWIHTIRGIGYRMDREASSRTGAPVAVPTSWLASTPRTGPAGSTSERATAEAESAITRHAPSRCRLPSAAARRRASTPVATRGRAALLCNRLAGGQA